MFGMAMKFLELGLEPIIKTTRPGENQTTSQNSNDTNENHTKMKAKSTEIINSEGQKGSGTGQTNQNKINGAKVTLQELKQSQQKVLQDFKKSIERSIAYSHHQPEQPKSQKSQLEPYDLVEGIVLSKIQQLSQEYLEYSIRKQPTVYHPNLKSKTGSLKLDGNQNKSSSCELIKSIVKSVLLPQSVTLTQTSQKYSLENVHLKQSSVKRSQNKLSQTLQNYNTGSNNTVKSSQTAQPVTEFIKELFESLGLIEKDEKMAYSLKEMTENARKKFNSLKGNDYVEKLNEMLQSVEGIGQIRVFGTRSQVDTQLKNTSSVPIAMSQSPSSSTQTPSTPRSESKSRKDLLIERRSEKKVKLVTPQTIEELHLKKNLMEKQISDALEFLTVSRRMRKFSFGSTSISEVLVNFSFDFQFMSYKRVKTGFFTEANLMGFIRKFCECTKMSQKQVASPKQQPRNSMVSLKWNLVNIAKGLKTKNFIKFEELLSSGQKVGKQPLHEDRCFSLLFKNRTYDFECESTAIRDEYFRMIKILIKSTCDV